MVALAPHASHVLHASIIINGLPGMNYFGERFEELPFFGCIKKEVTTFSLDPHFATFAMPRASASVTNADFMRTNCFPRAPLNTTRARPPMRTRVSVRSGYGSGVMSF